VPPLDTASSCLSVVSLASHMALPQCSPACSHSHVNLDCSHVLPALVPAGSANHYMHHAPHTHLTHGAVVVAVRHSSTHDCVGAKQVPSVTNPTAEGQARAP
jgi:hypothetical protein